MPDYSIKTRFLDFANARVYKFIRLMHGKRGENPPLPRNCNRRELSVVATEVVTWEGCSKAHRRESQETDQIPIFWAIPASMGELDSFLVFSDLPFAS